MKAGLDPKVRLLVEEFSRRLHETRPRLVEAVHVTGSALTDDWQPAHSDIDVVLVVTRPVDADDAHSLTAIHAATARDEANMGNPVDGVYLTPDQLVAGPDSVTSAPQVVNGKFHLDKSGGQLSWVTWLELAASPVGRVEPRSGELAWSPPNGPTPEVRTAAGEFSRANLAGYWSGVADEIQAWLQGPESPLDPAGAVPDDAVVWGALGVPRLVATIEQGRVISKTASGEFAAQRWPAHADLVRRSIASRAGATGTFTVVDAWSTVALIREVVTAGQSAVFRASNT